LTRRASEALVLPSETERVGTLILVDVASLTLADQQRLHAWLDGSGNGVRIVSTGPESILPMIRVGAFMEALYYRLNTLVLECQEGGAG
jgi:DNA-binding NtrC family response regulator